MLKIDIKDISIKKHTDTILLLKNIKFNLTENKIFTILGKNGTGKSTLIKSITKLLDTDIYSLNAEVICNGKDIYKINYEELLKIRASDIKYIFQDAINSFDYLKQFGYYFNKFCKDENEISDLLEYFILPGKEKLFKVYPYEVSGGMAQRISLVLALLTKPELLILDEPTSGIDSAIANLMLLKLKDFVTEEGNSVLLVTQDILFAQKISDEIAMLKDLTLSPFYKTVDFFNKYNSELLLFNN
ncbi:MAG: hypothetical protein CO128_01555 [Ignavibacteriales bacterium CG_4_9_14_3_um_filter_30_11]|nr:MAG: hypothetical protein CO128_01555 [Ignavibacteriales bacterium CG_4_9_14_3_um_filter_30_11]